MNDTDKKKLQNALSIVDSLQGQLSNIAKRGPGAAKEWAADMARAQAENKPKIKSLVSASVKLVKDAKSVVKDLEALYKEGSDVKRLAGYADGKTFRTKTAKHLASGRSLYDASTKLRTQLLSILGGGMYPGMSNVDVKAFVVALQAYERYFDALRVDLAKL